MSIQFLDPRHIGAFVIDAWQNELNTEMDPADGQWFTNGPDNNGGLYGKLTDTLASELVFDSSRKIFTPHQLAADTHTVDNRNGLTKTSTVTVTFTYQDATTTTHSTTDTIKAGVATEIKAKSDFLIAGAEVTQKFTAEYNYAWTDTSSTTKTETRTFQQVVPINVPEGRVYQLVLMANKDELSIPYSANIYLDGTSTANFANPANGQTTWTIDAGALCAMINKYASAEGESSNYGRDPANPARGMISLHGTMTATQTTNFIVQTFDITESYQGGAPAQVVLNSKPGSPGMSGARLVDQRRI